jgi:hypothetical protein
MTNEESNTIYWLDKNNMIIKLSDSWDSFAIENDGDVLSGQSVIGKKIWDYIQGNTTRMWMDALFSLARLHQKTVQKPYRCDSPELKRYMEMVITPEENGVLKVESRVLSTEVIKKPFYFQASNDLGSPKILIRCSICNRLKQKGQWQEVDQLSIESTNTEQLQVAYGVCPDCHNLMPKSQS